jgi:hypothetical protein
MIAGPGKLGIGENCARPGEAAASAKSETATRKPRIRHPPGGAAGAHWFGAPVASDASPAYGDVQIRYYAKDGRNARPRSRQTPEAVKMHAQKMRIDFQLAPGSCSLNPICSKVHDLGLFASPRQTEAEEMRRAYLVVADARCVEWR